MSLVIGCVRVLSALSGSARDTLREIDDAGSRRVLGLLDQRASVLFTLQAIGAVTEIALVLATASLLSYLGHLLYAPLVLSLSIQIPIIAGLVAVGAYLFPKWLASRHAIAFAQGASPFIAGLYYLVRPITLPLTRWLERIVGYGHIDRPHLSDDDFKSMADLGEAQGTIEEEERELIHSILDFGDTTVREIMVSRMDMNVMPISATLDEAYQLLIEGGHSRLPLYDEHLDNIVGIIYVKDLLPFLKPGPWQETPDWRVVARKTLFVPYGKPLVEMLNDFQSQNIHMAIVVDEYGGTAGLVTMEDVLEEIVGDIRDETDNDEEALHRQVDAHTHSVDARIHIDDLMDLLQVELDVDRYDFETLGGLIFHLTGDIPSVGDEIAYDGLTLRIESVENHRIGRVLVHVQPPAEDKSIVV
ncbi:MAG: hemolysin family protein [Rhodothermales bacterium]|nr:hemolysin family protein [Rhodothermales bacterium]